MRNKLIDEVTETHTLFTWLIASLSIRLLKIVILEVKYICVKTMTSSFVELGSLV